MKKFNLRKGDISVRTCNENLTSDGKMSTAEIVKWEGDGCYTLAY